MPEIIQLELDLNPYLETAQAFPEAAEMRELLDLLDHAIAHRPVSEQLELAGTAIAVLGSVFEKKAEKMLDRWDAKWNPREPILPNLTNCAALFVQGQQLRLDDLFEEPEPHYYPESRKSTKRTGSVVVEADGATLADAVEADATALQKAISLAHTEDVEAWINLVQASLTNRMKLLTLQKKSGLSIVQVWIALLFGGFRLERIGDFYEGTIFVSRALN